MARYHKALVKKNTRSLVPIFILIILATILAAILGYHYFTVLRSNSYVIKNKYYGFELKTPKNWTAQKNSMYTEELIASVIDDCKKDKDGISAYKVGDFKFEDQKFPPELGIGKDFPKDIPTGAILEVTIKCVPESVKDKLADYGFGSIKIAGEKAFQSFFELFGFGSAKNFSFNHNGLQYNINEYVFVSEEDKADEQKIRNSYQIVFNRIISSFRFINQ